MSTQDLFNYCFGVLIGLSVGYRFALAVPFWRLLAQVVIGTAGGLLFASLVWPC